MPRRSYAQDGFHMDHLRTSPSQQHLDPTSRSSTSSQPDQDELDQDMLGAAGLTGPNSTSNHLLRGAGQRPHKLDLYSIPVFLLECLALGALAYGAYFLHFQYKPKPLISGFYCDDISLRQSFSETKFSQQFRQADNELTVLVLLMLVPLVILVFCELVNSMFGSLKFRQIRSLCKCCKLHSITRRTLRFSGAYLLGFLIVVISCDILATSAGKFRPFFAQECPQIYQTECLSQASTSGNPNPNPQPFSSSRDLSMEQQFVASSTNSPPQSFDLSNNNGGGGQAPRENLSDLDRIRPLSQPISSVNSTPLDSVAPINVLARTRRDITTSLSAGQQQQNVFERKWIDLSSANLKQLCQFSGDEMQTRKFDQLQMSWPSFPGAIFTYACFYLAAYLSFVGTARPFRMLTSILVMILILTATIFNVQLVKEHYNHWEDVAGGLGLSLLVVLFVILVYLNKFRDTHYYEYQKLFGSASRRQEQLRRSLMLMSETNAYKFGYSNEAAAGQYQLDKVDNHLNSASAPVAQNGTESLAVGSSSNNDLAMRYFQIPRANYRGAPRPLSALNRN